MVQKKSLISNAAPTKKAQKTTAPAPLSANASTAGAPLSKKMLAKRVSKVVASKASPSFVATPHGGGC